jgi:PKD repeat protein
MMGVGLHRRGWRQARSAATPLVLALGLLFPCIASAAQPIPSFTFSPSAPLTLETVTFTSTSTGDITSETWDLDNDGSFDDATGPSAARSFASAGIYLVRLRVQGPGGYGDSGAYVSVSNRLPAVSLTFFPSAPVAGDVVNFVSTARDPDGTITNQLWDLDNDGGFDDGTGSLASTTFPAAGTYVVRLWAADNNRAEQITAQNVVVSAAPLKLLSSFPVVRVVGKATGSGVSIRRFTVEAPVGATVEVRCRGGGCPRRGQVRKVRARTKSPKPTRLLRFRRFERRLKARAALRIFITKPGAIGKYTSFRVRKGKAPKRRDLCMLPGAKLPSPCPGT